MSHYDIVRPNIKRIILLEGTDFSGKTTLANAVMQQMNTLQIKAIRNSGSIYNSKWSQYCASIFQKEGLNDFLFSLLITPLPIIDRVKIKEFFAKSSHDVILQDSYFHRSVAFSWSRNHHGLYQLKNFLSHCFLNFDLVFYLEASYSVRLQRFYTRKNPDKYDRVIIDDPTMFEKNEKKLKELVLSAYPKVVFFNTDEMDVNSMSQIVINKYIQLNL